MARIPASVANGNLDRGQAPNYSGLARSPVGAALQDFGQDMQVIGARFQAQRDQAEDFEALQGFNRFKIAAGGDLTEIGQKTPVNGMGFHDNAMGAFKKRETEFMANVPERLRPKFQTLIETERAQFSQQQAQTELTQRQKWYRDGLSDAVSRGQEQVYNNPAALEAAKQEALREVDASGLSDIEKADWREKVEQGLASSLATRMLTEDPAGLASSLGVATQPVVLPADPNLPAGMRNNNPGNIKFVGQGRDQGVLGPSKNTDQGDPQAVFATPEAGMAAAYKLAMKKYGDGKTTANSIIAGDRGWTPGNFDAAKNIARTMGVSPDADLNLSDPRRAQSFLRALVRQEHGSASDGYSDDMIRTVVEAKGQIVFNPATSPSGGTQGYLEVASAFLGAHQGRDAGVIAEFIKRSTGVSLDPRQTAWCAAYVNAVLGSQGTEGTGRLNARSFLDYGAEVTEPEMGDIVVLSRGDPNGWQGHVGFYAGRGADGKIKVLGGNQSKQVSVAEYDAGKVLGFRRPPSVPDEAAANERLSRLPGGGPSAGMVVTKLDPRFASLPFADRLKLVAQANQQSVNAVQQLETQRKAQYTAYNESMNLGILTGAVASEDQILFDPVLGDGDKAARLNQFRSKQKDQTETDRAVQDFLSGNLRDLNPLDSDQRKTANKVFDVLQKNLGEASAEQRAMVEQNFISQTGVVPDPVAAQLRRGLYSENPQELADTLDRAGAINDTAPIAFDNMPNGEQLRRDMTSFQSMVNSRGMSATEAAQRLIQRRSEDYQRNEKILGPEADKAVKDLTVSDVTRDFATGWFGFGAPGSGVDPSSQNQLLAEYREVYREEFIRAGGDTAEAKSQSLRLLKKTWGESTVSGQRQLMKYPPEQFYQPFEGGFGYLRDDAMKTAGELIGGEAPANVFLRPDAATAADIREGRPPRYRLFYTREVDGQTVVDQAPGFWAMNGDAVSSRVDAQNAEIMQQAEQVRIDNADRVPGTDREQASDMFLGGYGVPQPGGRPIPQTPLPTMPTPGSREAIKSGLDERRQQLMDDNPVTSVGSAM